MASVVDIKFVDESENFDFEKSGKSSRPRRENWSMLYIAESDESDVESIESRDASSFEEDVEISSFENESEESASASASSSESFASVDEEDESDEEKTASKSKKKSAAKTKPGKKANGGTSASTSNKQNATKPRGRKKKKESNTMTNEELEDLCFELGEKKDELAAFTKERLENAGDINFFTTRGLLRNAVIRELPEFLDEVNESFMETMRIAFAKKVSKAERKASLSHCWLQKLPSFLKNEIWSGVVRHCCDRDNCSEVSRGDQISVLACITEAVYDFAHIHSHSKIASNSSVPETQLCAENDVILHRFGGAAIYRMEKVRRNTVNHKKGTMKVTDAHRENLKKELEIIQKMRRDTMKNLPREISVHLNEGGLHFMKDEMIEFVRKADNHTRKFTVSRFFRRNPSSFLNTVFDSVYGSEELFDSFVSSLKSIGVSGYDQAIVRAVYRELLKKLCRTRVKSFMQGLREQDLETDKKVCDADSSLRDKLKGYAMTSKRN